MYKSIKAYLGLKLLGLDKKDIATGDTVQAQTLIVDNKGKVYKQNAHFIHVQNDASTSWSVVLRMHLVAKHILINNKKEWH